MNLKSNRQIAINYSVLIHLLKYSQKVLFENFNSYKELFFSSEPILEKSDVVQKQLQVNENILKETYRKVLDSFKKVDFKYSILTTEDQSYPSLLKQVSTPPPILFCRGDVDLFQRKAVSVVGARSASLDGLKRAQKLSFLLVEKGFVVVSGLAKGIDSSAHNGAIKIGGKTIAVIGTPLDKRYPKENALLQEKIAESHLLVSQFPFSQPTSKFNFPIRNYTMCGLTNATVIVEASEKSGALIQARFCLKEGRSLFVLKNLLERKDITWPRNYVKKGAIVLEKIEDVLDHITPVNKVSSENIQSELSLFDDKEKES